LVIGGYFASAFLVLLPEALRFVGMPDSIAANMRQIIYGLILVLVMMTGKNGVKDSNSRFDLQPLKTLGFKILLS